MKSDHLALEEIAAYINVNLQKHEIKRILDHISDCDLCLALVDEQWSKEIISVSPTSEIDLEKRLMGKIHHSNLISSMIKLAVAGSAESVLGIINPLLKLPSRKIRRNKPTNKMF